MVRRRNKKASKFIIEGIKTQLDRISKVTAEIAAEKIVTDLKEKGPYYSGEFEENWVVVPGETTIPANKPSSFSAREKWSGWESGAFPFSRRTTPAQIPPLPIGQHQYTIGNQMKYRDIALDLTPGRWADGKENTAPRDWFRTYMQGGGLFNALKEATGQASRDPQLKGKKGFG